MVHERSLPFDLRAPLIRPCNGILCFAERVFSEVVHLYNPTTLEHLILPPGLFHDDEVYRTESIGFGFDQSTDDYKVVRIRSVRRFSKSAERKGGIDYRDILPWPPGKRRLVEVYRVSTNRWSEVDVKLPRQERICGTGVFLNGFFHWLGSYRSGDPPTCQRMITFDFERDKLGEMQCPGGKMETKDIIVVGGSLAMCFETTTGLELWVMAEYGNDESWFKKLRIDGLVGLVKYWFHDNKCLVFESPTQLKVFLWTVTRLKLQSSNLIALFLKALPLHPSNVH